MFPLERCGGGIKISGVTRPVTAVLKTLTLATGWNNGTAYAGVAVCEPATYLQQVAFCHVATPVAGFSEREGPPSVLLVLLG